MHLQERKGGVQSSLFRCTSYLGPVRQPWVATIQDSLQTAVKLAFVKDNIVICVLKKASEELWARVVAQTHEGQMEMQIEQKRYRPIAFFGGKFVNAQRNWTTYEKVAYAIVQKFDRRDYLFWGSLPMHIFAVHRNLLFISHTWLCDRTP